MNAYSARFYDAYFTGVDGEVEFYVDEAHDAAGAVLELGCGTGRVLLPIARAGVDIVGLDLAADLLAALRDKLARENSETQQRVDLVRADMCDFQLRRRFAAIFVPYRTFQHLLTPDDQLRSLEQIAQHLDVGGRLVFNTHDPLAEWMRDGFASPVRKDVDFIDAETGNRISVYYRAGVHF
jgi:SAM-dependent methyltransferase